MAYLTNKIRTSVNGSITCEAKEKMTMIEKAKMSEIIKLVKDDKFEEIYNNVYLFLLVHMNCIVNVIFKRNWNKYRSTQNYYTYVSPSDEAFAYIILENNAERYTEIADSTIKKEDYCKTTKYTFANDQRLKGVGWKNEGILKFFNIQKRVELFRETKANVITELAENLKQIYSDLSDNDEINDLILSQEEMDSILQQKRIQQDLLDQLMRRTAKKQKINTVIEEFEITQQESV